MDQTKQHLWCGILAPIDPEGVDRSVRLAGGLCSWHRANVTTYQLGTTRLTLHTSQQDRWLTFTDTTPDRVRNTAARLGYQPDDLAFKPLTTSEAGATPPEHGNDNTTMTS